MISAISAWASRHSYFIAERAYVLQEEGRYREAVLLFDGLLALNPLDTYCRESIGALYLALGEWQEAIHHLSIIVDADPLNVNALARRCDAYIRLDRLSDAERDLQLLKQLRASPHTRRLQSRMATAKQGSGGRADSQASSVARQR